MNHIRIYMTSQDKVEYLKVAEHVGTYICISGPTCVVSDILESVEDDELAVKTKR